MTSPKLGIQCSVRCVCVNVEKGIGAGRETVCVHVLIHYDRSMLIYTSYVFVCLHIIYISKILNRNLKRKKIQSVFFCCKM